MSQVEVIRSEGPAKKDWEVHYHAPRDTWDEERIVIKKLEEEENNKLVIEKELEFDEGNIRLRMRGCTFGQMTKRAEESIGKFLGAERWERLWDKAVKEFCRSEEVQKFYEVGLKFNDEEPEFWCKDVTETINKSGLWEIVNVVRACGTRENGRYDMCVRFEVPKNERPEVSEAKARAFGALSIYKAMGSAGTKKVAEDMTKFIVGDVWGDCWDKDEGEEDGSDSRENGEG